MYGEELDPAEASCALVVDVEGSRADVVLDLAGEKKVQGNQVRFVNKLN